LAKHFVTHLDGNATIGRAPPKPGSSTETNTAATSTSTAPVQAVSKLESEAPVPELRFDEGKKSVDPDKNGPECLSAPVPGNSVQLQTGKNPQGNSGAVLEAKKSAGKDVTSEFLRKFRPPKRAKSDAQGPML